MILSATEIDTSLDYSATIGNFDGCHLGHQKLLKTVIEKSQNKEKSSETVPVVFTFKPHPKIVLTGKKNFFVQDRILSYQKILDYGIQRIYEFDFNRDISTLSASDFITKHIEIFRNIKHIVFGHDFVWGSDQKDGPSSWNQVRGSNQILTADISIESPFTLDGEVVSSSLIRKYIKDGDFGRATNLLDSPLVYQGKVEKGDQRGRLIGFPTANIQLDSEILPPKNGVYATRLYWNGLTFLSISNFGKRPTFKDSATELLETHIFDFDNDIYGENIRVEFIQMIRSEKSFKDANELIQQIQDDIKLAHEIFEGLK